MKKLLMICLSEKFVDAECAKLSRALDYNYLNLDGFVIYNLASQNIQKLCDKDYLFSRKQKILKSALKFTKMFYACGYHTYMDFKEVFKDCEVIYLRLGLSQLEMLQDENLTIHKLAYSDHDELFASAATEVVDYREHRAEDAYPELKDLAASKLKRGKKKQ